MKVFRFFSILPFITSLSVLLLLFCFLIPPYSANAGGPTITMGACCLFGICFEDEEESVCADQGGDYQGDDTLCVDVICPQPPVLDNKPQSFPNAINLCGKGKIPFAFVGTQDFDPCSLDPDILLVNGVPVELHKCSCEDVVGPEEQTIANPGSEDGIDDLTCRLKTSSLRESGAVEPTATEWEICLEDSFGEVICGTDSIKIAQFCDENGDLTFISEQND